MELCVDYCEYIICCVSCSNNFVEVVAVVAVAAAVDLAAAVGLERMTVVVALLLVEGLAVHHSVAVLQPSQKMKRSGIRTLLFQATTILIFKTMPINNIIYIINNIQLLLLYLSSLIIFCKTKLFTCPNYCCTNTTSHTHSL